MLGQDTHGHEIEVVATRPRGFLVSLRRGLVRLRRAVTLGMVLLALFLLEAVTACETTEEEPAVYYGPPPTEDTVGGDDAMVGQDTLTPDAADPDAMVAYYGPPDAVWDDITDTGPTPDVGPQEDFVTHYGPQPVDVVDDAEPEAVDVGPQEEFVTYYGPQPTDVVDDVDAVEDVKPESQEEWVAYYGPQPVDTVDDTEPTPDVTECEPVAVYGPQPCQTDQDCEDWYGEGWYCNTENEFQDPCGGTISWPMCEEK